MKNLHAFGIDAREGTTQDLIVANILRIVGSTNHNSALAVLLARLRSGDAATISMFLTDKGAVDMDEVTRFAKQHQPKDESFFVEVTRRAIGEIDL